MEALDLICRLIDYQRETVDIARRLSARERPRIINEHLLRMSTLSEMES
jgi:hypothetical protein